MLSGAAATSTTSVDTIATVGESSFPPIAGPVAEWILPTPLNLFNIASNFTMPQLAAALQERFRKAAIADDANVAYIGAWKTLNTVYTDFSSLPAFIMHLELLKLIPKEIPGAPDKRMRRVVEIFLMDLHRMMDLCRRLDLHQKMHSTLTPENTKEIIAAYDEYRSTLWRDLPGPQPELKDEDALRLRGSIDLLQWTVAAQPAHLRKILIKYLTNANDLSDLLTIYSPSNEGTTLSPSTISAKICYDLYEISAALPAQGQEIFKASLDAIAIAIREKYAYDEIDYIKFVKEKEKAGGTLETLRNSLHRLNTNEAEQSWSAQNAAGKLEAGAEKDQKKEETLRERQALLFSVPKQSDSLDNGFEKESASAESSLSPSGVNAQFSSKP